MKKITLNLVLVVTLVSIAACGGGGGDASTSDDTSTNYPYLLSSPRVSYTQNYLDPAQTNYDVTIELDATGPDPIYSVGLWVYSKADNSGVGYLDLIHTGGTTWSATTNIYIPLPSGTYYIDSILIEDGDAFAGELVKSAWYLVQDPVSTTHYTIDQRLTDTDPASFGILDVNFGLSNISIGNFTLP